MTNRTPDTEIFTEPDSPITDIPPMESGEHHAEHEYDDAEEVPLNPKQAAKNKLMGLAAAGGVGLLMLSFVGYQIYSSLNKPSPGNMAYQPPAAAAPGGANPYEAPAPITPSQAPQYQEQSNVAAPPPAGQQEATSPSGVAGGPSIAAAVPSNDPYQAPATNPVVINDAIAKFDKKFEQMEGRLEKIDSKLQALDTSTHKAKPSTPAARRPASDTEAAPRPAKKQVAHEEKPATAVYSKFTIVSIISGQAWVESKASGEVEIVRIGETLSDGSTVTAIDAAKGEVSTPRGKIVGK